MNRWRNDLARLQQWQEHGFDSRLQPVEFSLEIRFCHLLIKSECQHLCRVARFENNSFCHDIALPQSVPYFMGRLSGPAVPRIWNPNYFFRVVFPF